MRTMERNEAVPMACMQEGMPWDWESFPEFLDSLERTPKGLNLLAYVGLNPLMMYVMSDGSLSSNGTIDNSVDGRGKGEWSSDNSSTAGSFFAACALLATSGIRPSWSSIGL